MQHVPDIWLVNKKVCWFPHLQSDGKSKYFNSNQIDKMIKQGSLPNNDDGTNHDIAKIAGPFCKFTKLVNIE